MDLLTEAEYIFREIQRAVELGSTTVSRLSRWRADRKKEEGSMITPQTPDELRTDTIAQLTDKVINGGIFAHGAVGAEGLKRVRAIVRTFQGAAPDNPFVVEFFNNYRQEP